MVLCEYTFPVKHRVNVIFLANGLRGQKSRGTDCACSMMYLPGVFITHSIPPAGRKKKVLKASPNLKIYVISCIHFAFMSYHYFPFSHTIFSPCFFNFVSELCLEHYCNNGHLGDIFTKVRVELMGLRVKTESYYVKNFPSA